jgi:hypothetical protein
VAKKLHSQKADRSHMICSSCLAGDCHSCVDVLRVVYAKDLICQCRRAKHLGEPIDEQIKDPESGTVYGPGLSVTQLAEVAIDPVKLQAFIDEYTARMEEQ